MIEIDESKIEAGQYVLVVESWDEITSKPGQPYDFVTHRKGEVVDLDKFEARRLVKGGAVVTKADYEKAAAGPRAADSPIAVLDDEGLANLRAKLDLDDDADQATILAALDAQLDDVEPAKPAPWWGGGDEPKTIEAIEDKVGNDRALAAAALAAETAGSSPRPTLIAKLAAVITAAS